MKSATWKTWPSSKRLAMIWKPTGIPVVSLKPAGTLAAGIPAMLAEIVKMSLLYILTGSEISEFKSKAVSVETRPDNNIVVFEDLVEVLANQGSYLGRLQEELVVSAGRQGEGTQHDSPLYFVAKAF